MKTITHTDPHQTVRRALPYQFTILVSGKIQIRNTRDQILLVSQAEIERILSRDDLDVHRRRMYEAALEYLKNDK